MIFAKRLNRSGKTSSPSSMITIKATRQTLISLLKWTLSKFQLTTQKLFSEGTLQPILSRLSHASVLLRLTRLISQSMLICSSLKIIRSKPMWLSPKATPSNSQFVLTQLNRPTMILKTHSVTTRWRLRRWRCALRISKASTRISRIPSRHKRTTGRRSTLKWTTFKMRPRFWLDLSALTQLSTTNLKQEC